MTTLKDTFPVILYMMCGSGLRSPFTVSLDEISDHDMVNDELSDLRNNEKFRIDFGVMELPEFWCKLETAYPTLTQRAYRVLVPFVTTYLCESGFSALLTLKTKARNMLNVKHDMRLCLSQTSPRINLLVNNKPQHPSH